MRQYAGGPRQRSSGASGNLTANGTWRSCSSPARRRSGRATLVPAMRDNRPRQLCLTRGMLAFLLQHPRLVPAVAILRRLAIHTRGNRRLASGAADVDGGRRRDGGCAPTGTRKAAGAAVVKPRWVTPILASRPDYVCSARPHPVNVVAQAGQRRSGLNGARACVHSAISSAALARRKIVRNAPQVDELGGEFDESVQIGEVRGQAE